MIEANTIDPNIAAANDIEQSNGGAVVKTDGDIAKPPHHGLRALGSEAAIATEKQGAVDDPVVCTVFIADKLFLCIVIPGPGTNPIGTFDESAIANDVQARGGLSTALDFNSAGLFGPALRPLVGWISRIPPALELDSIDHKTIPAQAQDTAAALAVNPREAGHGAARRQGARCKFATWK